MKMDRTAVFSAVKEAIVNQPGMSYRRIAEEHGISVPTVQKIAGELKKETGFRRPLGRPLGSGKRNVEGSTDVL
jgi:hypothetical protein